MTGYDAFISYSHAKDKPLATALQSIVQRLGKPWYRRRSLRVFRDDASLSATPSLWPAIEQALAQSRYLILLASREAAASPWVAREVMYWLDHKGADTLLIAVTDGTLRWDHRVGDFVWHEDVPLPAVLTGRFAAEPKWVDLHAHRDSPDSRDAKLTELAANFAAAVHGVAKDDLLSQEVRQQRRALRLAWSAAAALLIFAGAAAWQWNAAVRSERIAVAESARAERNFTAAKSTIDNVMVDLVVGLRDIEGMRAETARRILGRAEAAMEKLASRTENDPEVLRSQAAMFGFFADTYTRLGDRPLAIEYFGKAINIYRPLVGLNRKWARQDVAVELAAALAALGGVRRLHGDLEGALAATAESLDIRRALVSKNPDGQDLRSDLSFALYQHGDVLRARGDVGNALKAYRESADISRSLVAQDPTNSERQRLLSIGIERIGVVQMEKRELAEALVAFRETLDIARRLTAKDPGNMEWRSDLTASLEYIGDVLLAQGDLAGARTAYGEALDIRRKLAASDPSNYKWQTSVVLLLVRLAWTGDDPRARWSEALEILRPLHAKGKLEPVQQEWIAHIEGELAKLTPVSSR